MLDVARTLPSPLRDRITLLAQFMGG